MSKNNFANEFVTKLNGKVKDEELDTILMELTVFLNDWEVDKRCTEICIYGGIPDAFKTYMVTKKIEGRSEGTLNLYKICLEDMFLTINKSVESITTNDLRVYLYKLQKTRKITDRTLDSRRLILNGFFSWCADEGYISKNPCASIQPIKYEAKPRVPFTDVEMELIRDGCVTLKEKAIIEVLYATGCRCSELTRLEKDDIDFKTREVALFGKGKKHRISYLNARAEVALKKYFEVRTDDLPYIFVTDKKPYRKMNNAGIEKILHHIGDRAGIDDVYSHRIRHTFATDALNHGMAITDLQGLMGHEKMDTTLIYGKISKTSMQTSHRKYVI